MTTTLEPPEQAECHADGRTDAGAGRADGDRRERPGRRRSSTGLLDGRAVPVLVAGLAVLLVGSVVVAVGIGAVAIAPGTVWSVIVGRLAGGGSEEVPANVAQIVWELRVPRVLLAAIVGAGLSVVGVAVQALVRNPLADPYVLGASSGASVGATLVILFGLFGSLGSLGITFAAFATSTASMAIVYAVAQQGGRLTPMRLVLSGVVVGYVLSAVTSFLVYWGDPRAAQQVLFWLLGSFGRARWDLLWIPAGALLGVFALLFVRARQLDALHAGDEAAISLGVPIARRRAELFVLTALMTAVMVAVSGAVGFVGLVVPHIVRLVVGGLHRRVLPVAALFGAVFMVWVDVVARTALAPQEVPIGILTAVAGGPLFLFLMRRRDRPARRVG